MKKIIKFYFPEDFAKAMFAGRTFYMTSFIWDEIIKNET